ncbi:MAG: TIGR02757 family protein [Chitinophagaceae bacterium]
MIDLKTLLDEKVALYNRPEFIADDPISIPHLFVSKQDIEIAGLFAALFAWGNRTIIINKAKELMQLMDMQPYDFILNHKESDLKRLTQFKHRTFNTTDLLYFLDFLQRHYRQYGSLEDAFIAGKDATAEASLNHFYQYFVAHDYFPARTAKHVACPAKKSHCKRLNMYLRWMVRRDDKGVDFGVWERLKMKNLIIPIDVHVARVAQQLGLLSDEAISWKTAVALTAKLKLLDPDDPVRYDFALFGMGINTKPGR